MEQWYPALDLFCLASHSEGAPMSLLEAQACGLPVVAADVGGIPLIVRHGETGLLAERNDVTTFGDHVSTLLQQSALAENMGTRARLRCRQEHNLEQVCRRLRTLFENLTERR